MPKKLRIRIHTKFKETHSFKLIFQKNLGKCNVYPSIFNLALTSSLGKQEFSNIEIKTDGNFLESINQKKLKYLYNKT